MRRILTLLLFTTICSGAQGQRLNPGDYIYPIRGVAGLYSANFGEMRPGHFHGGIDIKTDGGEGKPLVAVADGYVSRVSVSPSGYGRAIYLTLGNGTTAVYGHLQRFRGDIEKQVREERCRRRANSVDLWFGPGAWPVAQGDTIGFSGNSGSSMGPHLHFELRDTPTQRLYNVVREGVVRPDDDLPPRIMRIHYIEVDSVQGVPVHGSPESYAVVREAEGRYRLTREEPVGTGRKGYFVLEASDRRNGVHNTFGLWRASMSVDGDPRFEYRMDGFTHDLSRCCDAVSHYPMQLTSRNEVIRLAQLAESPDCFYPVMRERGLVRTAEGEKRRIRIEAEDDCGNRSQLEFDILGRTETLRAEADSTAVVLRPEKAALVRAGRDLTARIPRRSGLRTHFLPPGTASSPRIRLHGGDPLARLPHPRRRNAPAPPDDGLRTRLRARRHAIPHGSRDPYCQRTHRLHRRQIRRRRRDGDDPHHGRHLRRRRHHTAAHPAALQRRGRPRRRPQHPLPRERQFLRHRLLHAAHRRPLGALRPLSDAGHARTCVRPPRRKKTPQRTTLGNRRMRQYSPLGGNILAVNS